MESNRALMRSLMVGCVLLSWVIGASAQSAQQSVIVRHEVKHDVSLPLRDLARNAPIVQPGTLRTLIPGRRPTQFNSFEPHPDAVAQQAFGPNIGTTNLLNFAGLTGSASGGVEPPDTNGSVGSTQFVETVNLSYAVYDKVTGTKTLGPILMNQIWSGFGGLCQTTAGGDPVVIWDKAAQRWFVSELAYNGSFTSTFLCIAVSTSSDATGSYNRYAYGFGNTIPDYPKYAVWPDAYYVSINAFGNSGSTFNGAEPCAFDRNAMLSGGSAISVCITPDPNNYSFLPTDMDGATAPPAGAPNHYFQLFTNTTMQQYDFHVDFVNPNNSTFTGPKTITISNWTQICPTTRACIAQPSPGEKLDSLGDRLMFRAAYRNFGDHEAVVLSHTVKPGSGSTATAAARWYEVRATPPGGTFTVFQQGTLQTSANSLWMPSIAMDKVGDIAMGMSEASKTIKPSVIYTGRLVTDAKNKMEAPAIVAKGGGVQTGGGNRWGDYSSMSIDPADDCTFWFSQEYYTTTSAANWATRVNSFKFPSCQ